jgi:hypothetical protein
MIAAAVLVMAACGGGGGGSGGSVSTGLPPDEKLSALDDASAQKACQALSDSVNSVITPDDVVRAQCTSLAIRASASTLNGEVTVDVQKCQQMADACVANPPATITANTSTTDESDCSTSMADATLKGCDATVRDYEACANAVVGELQRRLAGFTCPNGKMLLNGDTELDFATLPECKTFQNECPDVPLTASVD